MIKKIFYYIFSLILSFSLVQCQNGDKTIDCFPNSVINTQINLSLPSYQGLSNVNGWAYIDAGHNSGTRGLIVVRSDLNSFKAYDRNAPHICPGVNTTLEIKDGIKLYCREDGAEWILSTGQPLTPNITDKPPKSYNAFLSGSSLYISSY